MGDGGRVGQLVTLWQQGRSRGEEPSAEDLCSDCPELLDELKRALETHRSGASGPAGDAPTVSSIRGTPAPAGDGEADRAEGEETEGLCDWLAPPAGPGELGR